MSFLKQPFMIDGLTTRKALDPSILRDASGQYRLYYLGSNAAGDPGRETGEHQIHLAISNDGINFRYDGPVFSHAGLVDPDVFVHQGKWYMYAPSADGIIIAISDDGRSFEYLQAFAFKNWATEAPVKLQDGSLRMYAFEEGKPAGNAVHSFISTNGVDWSEEPGDRMVAPANQKITSPSVVPWKNGYKMFYKEEDASIRSPPMQQTQASPATETPGPWDSDVIAYRVNADATVTRLATFERAGVPAIARLKDGRLMAAYQHFPANDPENFDRVAVRFSSDEGNTWTASQAIHLSGLPEGMRFPFDPTLVPLPDGGVRLYFTSLFGRQFNDDVPAIYSAISRNGIDYAFEPGVRFGIPGRYVIDCAVVLHLGVFHLYAPDNGARPVLSPSTGIGYHAISPDGLNFTRVEDVRIDGGRRWLGSAQSDGNVITFWGTSQNTDQSDEINAQRKGGLWSASSVDGKSWRLLESPLISGADPGAVFSREGGLVVVVTGPPRPGTPSAQRSRVRSTP